MPARSSRAALRAVSLVRRRPDRARKLHVRARRKVRSALASTAALLALVTVPGATQATDPPPLIRAVLIDDVTIVLHGDDLDVGGTPAVRLGTVPLVVQQSSPDTVAAELPPDLGAGRYRLRLRRPDGGAAKTEVTVGIVQRPQTVAFSGPSRPSIPGNAPAYVFAGNDESTGRVVITRPGQQIVGAGSVVLGLAPGSAPQQMDVGLCYEKAPFGTLVNFTAFDYVTTIATTAPTMYPAAGATQTSLPPGAYNVGICVRNNGGSAPLEHNNYLNGWVMVVG